LNLRHYIVIIWGYSPTDKALVWQQRRAPRAHEANTISNVEVKSELSLNYMERDAQRLYELSGKFVACPDVLRNMIASNYSSCPQEL